MHARHTRRTHPDVRRTFANLGKVIIEKKNCMRMKREKPRIVHGKLAGLMKTCLILAGLGVSIFLISDYIDFSRVFAFEEKVKVDDSDTAAAILAAEQLWRVCEKDSRAFRKICTEIPEDEQDIIIANLAHAGNPFFKESKLTRIMNRDGFYRMEVPVSGGSFSLIVHKESGVFSVISFYSLNMN